MTRAPGILGTTRQTFEYDGLSRLTRSTDNNDPASPDDDSLVTRSYDSLSRLLEELQNGRACSCEWTSDDDRIACVYPAGARRTVTLDRLDRQREIQFGGAFVARYDYIGTSRVLERSYGNDTRMTHLDPTRTTDIGFDGLRRVVRCRQERFGAKGSGGNRDFLILEYMYNRDSYATSERTRFGSQDVMDRVTYDSAYRVIDFRQNEAGAGTIPRHGQDWRLDGVSNWAVTNEDGVAKSQAISVMNEYDAFAGVPTPQDRNGNHASDGRSTFRWDGFNRLVRVQDEKGKVLANYAYHADNRRFRRSLGEERERRHGGDQDAHEHGHEPGKGKKLGHQEPGEEHVLLYFYCGWQVIEERDGEGKVLRQYVDGNGIDEHLMMAEDGERFFYHEDRRPMNVVALTDGKGRVVDRMRYTAYGTVSFIDEDGKVKDRARVKGNSYLFNGRQLHRESGLYWYRNRYYSPELGRFLSRDPLKYHDSMGLYEYVQGSPTRKVDPMGLQKQTRPRGSRRGGLPP